MKPISCKTARAKIHIALFILAMESFCSGCTASTAQIARIGISGGAEVRVRDLRVAPTGIDVHDSIVIVSDKASPSNASLDDAQMASCASEALRPSKYPTPRLHSLHDFRNAAFPDPDADRIFAESWDQLLNDPEVKRRMALFNFRYLAAVTITEAESLIVSGKVVDLKHFRMAGKVTVSVNKTSTVGLLSRFIPSASLSSVEKIACVEFGRALVKFVESTERPPQVAMTSLTLDHLFNQPRERYENRQNADPAGDGERPTRPNSLTADLVGAIIPPSPVGQTEAISMEKPASFNELKLAALNRMGIQSTTFVTKEAVDYEDAGRLWPSRGSNFQNVFCQEIKMSVNTLTLNTKALPPLPSRWHLGVVWFAKMVSLPIQLMIPVTAILAAPLSPPTALRGIETPYNCVS